MTHLIADEKLGGIQREYIEVARKADVGDYVHITYFEDIKLSEIRKVAKLNDVYPGDFYISPELLGEDYFNDNHEEYCTLEPTDIVVIDGTRFRLAERKAEVGEKIIVVKSTDIPIGFVSAVETYDEAHDDGSLYVVDSVDDYVGTYIDGYEDEYRVLIPIKPSLDELVAKMPAESEREYSPDIYDLLSNLAERVTSLERIVGELVRAKTPADERFASLESRLIDTQRNVQTFAELAETTRLTKDDALHATIEALCAHIAKTGGGR